MARIKLLIYIIIVILLIVFAYLKFRYTDKERIIMFFTKHEQNFIELKDIILKNKSNFKEIDYDKLVYSDTSKNFLDVKNKLNVSYILSYIDEFTLNRIICFKINIEINLGIFLYSINSVEYRYYKFPFSEYTEKDGYSLIKINEHWGFVY
jgi:hypothetical protein